MTSTPLPSRTIEHEIQLLQSADNQVQFYDAAQRDTRKLVGAYAVASVAAIGGLLLQDNKGNFERAHIALVAAAIAGLTCILLYAAKQIDRRLYQVIIRASIHSAKKCEHAIYGEELARERGTFHQREAMLGSGGSKPNADFYTVLGIAFATILLVSAVISLTLMAS